VDNQVVYIVVRKKDSDNSFLKIDSVWTDRLKALQRLELVEKALYSNETIGIQSWKSDFASLSLGEIKGE
jgi:hypothetical protein